MQEREVITNFKHIYSHLLIKETKKPKELKRKQDRQDIMFATFGEERASRLIGGNEGADKLATKALKK